MPILREAKAAFRCARMKLASVKRLSGVRTNSGRPSVKPVMCSPE